MSEAVLFEARDAVLIITINEPARRNVLSRLVYEPIEAALRDATAAESGVRAVVITGAGGFFSAGGDLRMLKSRREMTLPEREAQIEYLHRMIRAIRACHVPVIAAVEGGAAGAGASLAFACDMIVAAEDAKFTLAYVKAGLVPDGGGSGFLTMNLPRQLATEMCLTGRPVLAPRMYDVGVVNRVVVPGSALKQALELAQDLVAGPPEAQAAIKALLSAPDTAEFEAHLLRERREMGLALGRDEALEGIRAFEEKRKPDFTN
ncbi:oxepin-CoA hydrolase, alternative type [Ruegeria lacuscaerulensis]|uniref:oxepin-CoA hydrolase, alternative type n=1 Tax=Ruegeria lacuscaerulensis TaxID=55218 RepID=UPI00147E9BA2|nr:enoyl-CoA hydratase family protein [Ruegeria lacuscaerulensis]